MGLKNRIVFGVHQVTTYNRLTGMPYGTSKVLGNSTFNMTGEQVELYGGSIKAPVAVEDANINTEISLSFKQIEDWMIQLFLGGQVTSTSTPSTGEVSGYENKKGTSVKGATGIASIGIKTGQQDRLKRGKYVVKAVTSTTVDVYALTDVDFARGVSADYVDNSLKINSAPLTITTGAPTEIPNFGVELTGGASAIGMTAGDTATFEVFSAYSQKMQAKIGGSSDVFPEFGALMVAQKASDGQIFDIDAYRCKGTGLPMGLAEKKFAEPEVKAKAFWDSEKNGIALITAIV